MTMGAIRWQSNTVPDLIIEVWEALDCESVGRGELEEIQKVLAAKFGSGAVTSPASIARTVADEGAVLRHPEVFECDSAWRERNLSEQAFAKQLNFSTLSDAVGSFGRIEEKRHTAGSDTAELKRLRDAVLRVRQEVLLAAQSKVLDAGHRAEAEEVAEWLAVWLRSPQLFPDWLDLRMRSKEFQMKFRT